MAAIKFIILCGLFTVALGFFIPQDHLDSANQYEAAFSEKSPFEDGEILIRIARSPQRRIEANVEHHDQHGTSANIQYTHPINDNLDAYVQTSRNFKYNDNSGHVGLRYTF